MIEMELFGDKELLKKLDADELVGPPLRHAFEGATELIEGEVKLGTPVDMGNLRRDITHEVASGPIPLWGKVGTHSKYAKPVEFGSKPHWTSVRNLEGWARRHHVNPYAVQRKIAKHGTPAHRMFELGWKSSERDVEEYFQEAAKAIEERFGR
ncbi:MAG: hypothetical protein SVY53_05065 [Chloroflexota bacterium]|nr:hypothetical protein [Chloroflexota bacterium]